MVESLSKAFEHEVGWEDFSDPISKIFHNHHSPTDA